MATTQKYGIKYPFTSNNDDGLFLDVNDTNLEGVKSQVLHVLFTPKGRKLRDPDFGTDLIKYIFSNGDGEDLNDIKSEISGQIKKYVPNVEFRNISVYKNDDDENSIVVVVEYGVKVGNNIEITTVGVKL